MGKDASMYCPVDGTEWREGISRCPEHHVDLLEELPDEFEGLYDDDDVPLLEQLGLEGVPGYVVIAVAVAAAVYAVVGILAAGFFALATWREWSEFGFLVFLRFLEDSARVVMLGGLGCLAAAVLGRAWVRLGSQPDDGPAASPARDEGAPDAGGRAAWAVAILSWLVIVFAAVWVATGVAISWDEVEMQRRFMTPFDPGPEPSDTVIALSAVNNAAYTCALGALVSMAALFMARAWGRIAPRR